MPKTIDRFAAEVLRDTRSRRDRDRDLEPRDDRTRRSLRRQEAESAHPHCGCPWPVDVKFIILKGPFKGREWVNAFIFHNSPHLDEDAAMAFAIHPQIAETMTNHPGVTDEDVSVRKSLRSRGWLYPEAPKALQGTFAAGLPEFKPVWSDEEADDLVEEMLAEGRNAKPIGIGRRFGTFNDHGEVGRLRDERGNLLCSAQLVCRAANVHKSAMAGFALKRINQSDVEAAEDGFGIGKIVKRHSRYGVEWWETFMMVYREVDLFMKESVELRYDCPKQFERNGQRYGVNGYIVAAATSNLLTMAPFLRGDPVNADVVVVTNDNGNAYIGHATSEQSLACHAAIVREIVLAEAGKWGMDPEEAALHAKRAFTAAGADRGMDVPGVGEVWHMTWSTLLNGSEGHDKEPTKLTRDEILACVDRALESVDSKTLVSRQRQRLLRRLNRLNADLLMSDRLFDENRRRGENLLREAIKDMSWQPRAAKPKGRQKVEDDDDGMEAPGEEAEEGAE